MIDKSLVKFEDGHGTSFDPERKSPSSSRVFVPKVRFAHEDEITSLRGDDVPSSYLTKIAEDGPRMLLRR